MAERKRRTAEPAAEEQKEETVAVEETKQEQVADAVIVFKKTDANGNITTEVSPLGNVQATEVQTLLELGVHGWRRQIGL